MRHFEDPFRWRRLSAVTAEAPQWRPRHGAGSRKGHNRLDIGMATVTLSSPRKSTRFCHENMSRSPQRWRARGRVPQPMRRYVSH